ncbi:helix-turn-helix domain-containing protein [Demequina flava]|uniref:helix-turn-helix domain-containing protein n=1 Tax=Demequina flava TaxID=1095025 RepID=UPI00078467A3|nr:helix-turn-helix domain-containing protein [Demequina flava]
MNARSIQSAPSLREPVVEPLLTISDVCTRTRLSRRRVDALVADGVLPAYKIKKVRGFRFFAEDVDALFERVRVAA